MLEDETFRSQVIECTYFVSSFLFILALGGLSSTESSRKGNYYGMWGMFLAVVVTFLLEGFGNDEFIKFFSAFLGGGLVGLLLAVKVRSESFYLVKGG